MKRKLLTISALLITITAGAQSGNVGIGTIIPDSSAQLDITATDKGVLLTRINLTSLTDAATISGPASGLLVWNINATLGTGYYYNAGTPALPNWVRLQSGTTDWSLTGNTGTSSSTNFLGTKDNHSLKFKVNNQLAGFIDSASSGGSLTYGRLAGSYSVGVPYPTYNTLIGQQAGANNAVTAATLQGRNTGVGYSALQYTSSGFENTSLGYLAMAANNTGLHNTAIGSQAMANSSTFFGISGFPGNAGEGNVAVGWKTIFNNTGSYNIGIGFWALGSSNSTSVMNSGSNNIALGYQSLYKNTTGENNVAIGGLSGQNITTGKNNVLIGYNAGVSLVTESNRLEIANSTSTLISGDFGTGVLTLNSVLKLTPLSAAPATPAKGMIYFDDGQNKALCYDGTTWQPLW